jgi:glycosyltransferase involved in cell wall biosynthesis
MERVVGRPFGRAAGWEARYASCMKDCGAGRGEMQRNRGGARVTIGMPVYNAERYIDEALASLLGQSFDDFELIISDNASTDRTEEVCRLLARKDDRILYIRNRLNYGVIHNFNQVLRISSGEYFKWAASDDVCGRDYLRRAVDVLDADPSVVLVWARTVGIDEHGNRVGTPAEVSDLNSPVSVYSPDPVVRFRRLMRHMWWVNGPFYGVIRAESLANRLHPIHMSGDQILLTELSLLGRFYEIPDVEFLSRVHVGKTSRASTLKARALVVDPPMGGRRSYGWWRLVRGYPQRIAMYLSIISRAPIPLNQKLLCYEEVARTIGWWTRLRASRLLPGSLAESIRPEYPRE